MRIAVAVIALHIDSLLLTYYSWRD